MTTEYVPQAAPLKRFIGAISLSKPKNKGEMDMKKDDSLKRIKAMAEALAKIQKAQDEQKAMQAMEEAEDDDMDLVTDMLMEIADLLSQAAELSAQAAALINGEDIEADCFPRCCVMEVYFDDEL